MNVASQQVDEQTQPWRRLFDTTYFVYFINFCSHMKHWCDLINSADSHSLKLAETERLHHHKPGLPPSWREKGWNQK